MKIKLTTIYVNDQEKALHFYTDVLGLVKKTDVSADEVLSMIILGKPLEKVTSEEMEQLRA